MGLQTLVITLADGTLVATIDAAPLDIDTTGNTAGVNLIRGVPIRDFGIDSTDNPYFQVGGADPGEEAAIAYDPDSGSLSLIKGA